MERSISKQRVKQLLHDSLCVLCQNTIAYNVNIKIEALIGITIDDDDILLVNINEQLSKSYAENNSIVDPQDANMAALHTGNISEGTKGIRIFSCSSIAQEQPSANENSSQQLASESASSTAQVPRIDNNCYVDLHRIVKQDHYDADIVMLEDLISSPSSTQVNRPPKIESDQAEMSDNCLPASNATAERRRNETSTMATTGDTSSAYAFDYLEDVCMTHRRLLDSDAPCCGLYNSDKGSMESNGVSSDACPSSSARSSNAPKKKSFGRQLRNRGSTNQNSGSVAKQKQKSRKMTKRESEQDKHHQLRYMCFHCGVQLDTESAYRKHKRFHKGIVQVPHCAGCGKSVSRLDRLQAHQQKCSGGSLHEDSQQKEGMLRCGGCGKRYCRSESLVAHMKKCLAVGIQKV